MVEVATALGIIAFALLAILALLPMGIKSNQISTEETRAVNILSAVAADLGNTHPSVNGGKSMLFGFALPYAINSAGRKVLNPGMTSPATVLDNSNSIGLDEGENKVDISTRPPFRASVIYTRIPEPGRPGPIQARLIVSWPGGAGASIDDLTNPAVVGGSVEAIVSFSEP